MPLKLTRKKFNILTGKSKSRKKREHPEQDMQIDFITKFRKKYPCLKPLLFSTHGESLYKRQDLIKMGAASGIPDMFFCLVLGRYGGLWIELKVQPNKPSKEQLDFMQDVEMAGYKAEVCYSCLEALKAIEEYLDQDRHKLGIVSQALSRHQQYRLAASKPKLRSRGRR